MGWLRRSLRSARSRWPLMLLGAIAVYFAYHGIHGQRGLYAWLDRNREVEALKAELDGMVQERKEIEREMAGLAPGQLDRDVLEGQLRELGYIKPGEVIVLTPEVQGK